jgi:hypothetical protein
MDAHDQWFVRRGPTVVGPVSMRLLLRGIQAGKIPRDCEARHAAEKGWRDLFDVVVSVASALSEEPELMEPLDMTDEERTLITESPFTQQQAASPGTPSKTGPSR